MLGKIKAKIAKIIANPENREIVIGSTAVFIFKVLGTGTTFFYIWFITHTFGASTLGIFSLCFTILLLSSLICVMGFDSAALKFIAEFNITGNQEQICNIYWRAWRKILLTASIISALLFFLAPPISIYILQKPTLITSLKISAIAVIPMALRSLNQECLRAIKKNAAYSFFLNLSIYLFSGVILLIGTQLEREQPSTLLPIIAIVGGISFTWVVSQVAWTRNLLVKTPWPIDKSRPEISDHQLNTLARSLILAKSMSFVMQWSDTLVIGIFCTAGQLGVYTVVIKIINLVNIPYMIINAIAAPMIIEAYKFKGLKRLNILIRKLTLITGSCAVLIGGSLFLLRYEALSLFGKEFTAGVVVLQILLIGKIIQLVTGPAGLALQMIDKEKVFKHIMLYTATINIILNFLFIPEIGINGAAIATALSMSIWSIWAKKELTNTLKNTQNNSDFSPI